MNIAINEVSESIQEANIHILELNKNIREAEWSNFDYLQDRISQITTEADFLISLLENSKLFDDNGQLTNEGKSTVGLHGVNYNVYMGQADRYAQEAMKLSGQIAADPYNADLIDRRDELIRLQQQSILAAEEEKQAIKSLVEEGIDVELSSMKELIDAYNDSLDSAKDLYEYQKKIADQSKKVADIEKQLAAYANDNSEETRATVQKLKVSLDEAKSDLEETQYDYYIKNQKKILDDLYNQYEDLLNQRLDNIDGLVEEMIAMTNENAATISATINEAAGNVGYSLTSGMHSIWDNGFSSINSVITMYGDNFSSALTSVNATLESISANISAMLAASNARASEVIGSAQKTEAGIPSNSGSVINEPQSNKSPATTPVSEPAKAPEEKEIRIGGLINAGNAPIYSFAGDTNGKHQYFDEDPIYTVIDEKNGYLLTRWHKLSSGLTGWFKKSDVRAYKTGGLVDFTGIAQLDGSKSKPEYVLNPNDTQNFLNLTEVLRKLSGQGLFMHSFGNYNAPALTELSDITSRFVSTLKTNGNTNNSIGDVKVEINIDHVQDYNDFMRQIQNDRQFEEFIKDISINRLSGGSSLAKFRHSW